MKTATIIFAACTVISAIMVLFFKINIPGLSPISFGITLLLLGIMELNMYFKTDKRNIHLGFGILFSLLFVFDIYIGICQIINAIAI